MNSTCNICAESFNRSARIKVKCEYCDFEACRVCCETYLLSQTTPHCMDAQCGKLWTRKYMARTFTHIFMTTKYKAHREKILFEQEQALMPSTQLTIEREIYKEKKFAETFNELRFISAEIDRLLRRKYEVEYLRTQLRTDSFVMDFNEGERNGGERNEEETKGDGDMNKKQRNAFVFKCSNDECLGFLSSRWKCGLCEKWTCPDCRINVGTIEQKELHVCKEDDLKTAQLLKKDSRPCPKCGVIIFKISGCDQMFCTQCHTPFSWKTGELQNGRTIHNPHYFAYMATRRAGEMERNPRDIPCGQEMDRYFADAFNTNIRCMSVNDREIDVMMANVRNIIHLNAVDIESLTRQIDNYGTSNLTNRIKFMRQIITEEQFKRSIQSNEKKRQKNNELVDLYVMIRDTATDMFRLYNTEINNIFNENPNMISRYSSYNNPRQVIKMLLEKGLSMDKLFSDLNNLRSYANECLTEISKTYKSVHKKFDEKFELVDYNVKQKETKNQVYFVNEFSDDEDDNAN